MDKSVAFQKIKNTVNQFSKRRELNELTEENRQKVVDWFEKALFGQEIVFK